MENKSAKTTVGTGACLLSFPTMLLSWALASGRLGPSDALAQTPNVAALLFFAASFAAAASLRSGNAERGGDAVRRRAANFSFLGASALVGSVIGCACAGRGLLGA